MTELTMRILDRSRNCHLCSRAIVSLTGHMTPREAQLMFAEDVKRMAGGCVDTFRENVLKKDFHGYRDGAIIRYGRRRLLGY